MSNIDYGQSFFSLTGELSECGDVGLFIKTGEKYLIALIDGLGHGVEARQAAELAKKHITENLDLPLRDIMGGMHQYLKGSRGAVAAICKINAAKDEIRYSGVGNITARLIAAEQIRMIPKDGVIGYSISTPTEIIFSMQKGDVLILYSDGISEHFDIENIWELKQLSAQQIADKIMMEHSKKNDDASCLVLKRI